MIGSAVEIVLIAVGLAMDAFAVSVCKGLKMTQKIDYKYALLIAFFFGLFQAIMPYIGWLVGRQFEAYITGIDHWVAFVLLVIIGAKMVYEAIKNEEDDSEIKYDLKEITLLAIATSIDALAVGVSFAFLDRNIYFSAGCIGVITFLISFMGVIIGNKFGVRFKKNAEIAGGVILILIGLKILLEGIGILF